MNTIKNNRNKRNKLNFCALLIFLLGIGNVYISFAAIPYIATPGDPLAEPWRWSTMPELNHQTISCMTKDSAGRVWFGVADGVMRYDGHSWVSFDNKDGFFEGKVHALCAASDGQVYAASGDSIWRFKNEKWLRVPIEVYAQDLSSSKKGIWVSSEFGVIHLDGEEIQLFTTTTSSPPIKKAFPKTSQILYLSNEKIGNERLSVSSTIEDPSGSVWIMAGKRVVHFNPQKPFNEATIHNVFNHGENGLNLHDQNQLFIGNDGEVIIVNNSSSNIMQYDADSTQWKTWDLSNLNDEFTEEFTLHQCTDNTWLIGLTDHIYTLHQGTWHGAPHPSLGPNKTLFLETTDGALWTGKMEGKIVRIDRSNRHWKSFEGLQFQCNSHDGSAWFLSENGGVVQQNGTQWIHYGESDGIMNDPRSIYCSKKGTLWIAGNQHNVAATAYWSENRWIRHIHSEYQGFFDRVSITELKNHSLIFCGLSTESQPFSTGLIRTKQSENNKFSYSYEHLKPDQPQLLTSVAEHPSGSLLYGGSSLWEEIGTKIKRRPLPAKVNSSFIDVMTKDSQDRIWMSVHGNGLFLLDGTNWTHYASESNVGGSRISDLSCATNGVVWASRMDCISRFDGKQWVSNVFDKKLPGFSLKQGSLRTDSEDGIWFNYTDWSKSLRESKLNYVGNKARVSFKTIRYQGGGSPPETTISLVDNRVPSKGNIFCTWEGSSPWKSTKRADLHYSWRLNNGAWSVFAPEASRQFLALEPGDYRLEVRARDQYLNIDPTPAEIEFVVLAPVWQQTWFIAWSALILGGAFVLGCLLIRSNSRNKKHKIELREIKLRFFSNISHELRTPLTVMLGPLQSMLEKVKSDELREQLQMVLRNGQQLRQLVDQILDFRNLEAGKMPAEWAQGDLIQYVHTLVKTLEPLADHRAITLAVVSENETCMTWFDPEKVHKICNNLIMNAIKHSPTAGQIALKLSVIRSKTSTRFRFCIEDSGKGIPPKTLTHIFEQYYRTESNEAGTGIGLALVKELVDLLNGTITVTSPVFKKSDKAYGSRFVVEFPVYDEAPIGPQTDLSVFEETDTSLPIDTHAKDSGKNFDLPVLLVVDDNEDVRNFIKSELDDLFFILEAKNGELGFKQALISQPDLVLADVMMPIKDGVELCKQLKSTVETSHIPVILLTAQTAHEIDSQGFQTGADDYVTKPFSMPLLKARILGIIESRRLLRENLRRQIQEGVPLENIESKEQIYIQRVLDIIAENMSNFEFDVEVLAGLLEISSRALRYKVKAATGQTPVTIIRTMRLNKAKELLENPQQHVPISTIAESVGFSNASNFDRAFKKQFGYSSSGRPQVI